MDCFLCLSHVMKYINKQIYFHGQEKGSIMANELPQNFEEFAEARREGFLRMKELKDKGRQV